MSFDDKPNASVSAERRGSDAKWFATVYYDGDELRLSTPFNTERDAREAGQLVLKSWEATGSKPRR